MSYLFISYNITISLLYTLNDFRIIFLLRDSATQELTSNSVCENAWLLHKHPVELINEGKTIFF